MRINPIKNNITSPFYNDGFFCSGEFICRGGSWAGKITYRLLRSDRNWSTMSTRTIGLRIVLRKKLKKCE